MLQRPGCRGGGQPADCDHDLTQAANDKQQLAPMIDKLKALPKELGRVRRVLADSGYLSEANVEHCAQAKIEPLIAMKRERRNASWKARAVRQAARAD